MCFPSGLDQDTVIYELVSCVIPETRIIKKRLATRVRHLVQQITVKWTQRGRVAQVSDKGHVRVNSV